MPEAAVKPYSRLVQQMMGEKSAVLSKAQALSEIGMANTAQPLWAAAASYEERLAPLLEALGRELEAAVHRISAASCYQKAGELGRAANFYHAALSGPLREDTRREVEAMLRDCLTQLNHSPARPRTTRRVRKTVAA